MAETNTDLRIRTLAKIRAALDGKAASINHGNDGVVFINMPDKSIAVLPTDSLDAIKSKLDNPFERKSMSVTGLQSGAFGAKLAELKQKMVERQNQGLAKIEGAQQAAAAKIDAATDGVAAKVDKEVEDAMAEFAEFTNGGPT